MRAVVKLNRNSYKRSTLPDSLDALDFIAMVGVFNENNVHALATVHRIAQRQGTTDGDDINEIQNAITQINDSSVAFILKYPDLEYAENTIDLSTLTEKGRGNYFVEQVLSAHAAMVETHMLSTPNKEIYLQDITTPRTTNRILRM